MTERIRIPIADDASIINHQHEAVVEAAWQCGYGKPSRTQLLLMASVFEDFDCLFQMSNRDRNAAINNVKRELTRETAD